MKCLSETLKKQLILFLALFSGVNSIAQEINEEEYINAYVVICDTSQDYYELREKMFLLNKALKIEIDTLGRGYDLSKKQICLPEDDEDEIYSGNFYPRRYPSETLSLEYLNYYVNGFKPNKKTIDIISLITDDKDKAELQIIEIKKYSENAFILNSTIYMGCMH